MTPRLVISGGAGGVDAVAGAIAHSLSVPFQPFEPTTRRWAADDGFKARNERLALAAECLVRIWTKRSKTYGSGWTADRAESLGKRVDRWQVQ